MKTKECKVLACLVELKIASTSQIAARIGSERKFVTGRIQALKRAGIIEGVGKIKKRLTTEFTYKIKLNNKPNNGNNDFVSTATLKQMEKFKANIRGTPWAQMAVLV